MPKTVRNEFDKFLTYEKLMEAHIKSRKGKGYRNEIINFNFKQEEYIMWLLNQLKTLKYKHGGYQVFYVTEPKLRKIEKFKGKQGVNFCGYKINEYRMKLRDKGKRKLKKKVRSLTNKIYNGEITSNDAKKYLAGHLGYIKYANSYNLVDKLFYIEE